ncbi:MAG: 16S rRNA (guanine(527)-N(7))-methyltransferase RsmG [Caldimonas sp.]
MEEATNTLGLSLTERQATQLIEFVELLARWNRTYNLTAVRDPAAMLTHHVLDCLAAVPPLRREGFENARVLDVGSGGGLPGVVWAVMHPDMTVTCVDSVGKKAAFIQHAAGALGLPRLQGRHIRVDAISMAASISEAIAVAANSKRLPQGTRSVRDERFDLVTSRAFASLADFVALTGAVLAEGGRWLAMKGKLPVDEIAALPADVEMFYVEPLLVPGLAAERCLVWIRAADRTLNTVLSSEESVRSHSVLRPGPGTS